MSTPKDLRYSEEHEWVKDEDGKYRSELLILHNLNLAILFSLNFQKSEMTSKRTSLSEALNPLKQYRNLYAPISGKVVEVNEGLEDSPEFVNESPYENAWMIVVEPSDVSELDELMSAEAYEKMTIGE